MIVGVVFWINLGLCSTDESEIQDYLTQFSGLVPGDLDPHRSPHHVTTLKRAYLKLRRLADRGVRFVGHGLAKDFRIISILIYLDRARFCHDCHEP